MNPNPHDSAEAGTTVPSDATDQMPAPTPTKSAPPASTGTRTSTIVWGAVVIVIGIIALLLVAGLHVDVTVVFISLLGGAGLALVIGSVIKLMRSGS